MGLIIELSQVSVSAFAFLFSELVQYSQNRVTSVSDLEKRSVYEFISLREISSYLLCTKSSCKLFRLEQAGFGIGQRVIELISCRDRVTRRETRIVNMLQVSDCLRSSYGRAGHFHL